MKLPYTALALLLTSTLHDALAQAPPEQGYPQQGYSQQAPPAPTPARLAISSTSEEARAATIQCAEAIDNYRLDLARERCAEAVAKDPLLALAHALLAEAHPAPEEARKSLNEAQAALDRRGVSDGERLLIGAIRALREGKLADGRRLLDALCGAVSAEPRAFLYRGRLRQRVGDVDGALGDYSRASELDSKYGPAQNAIGYAQLSRGKLDEAKAAFEKYVQLSPKEPNAHDSLAQLQLRRGEAGPAAESARRAVELDGKFLPARAKLGDSLLFLGRVQQARKEYGVLEAATDQAQRHEGAMRAARSYLFDGPGLGSTLTMANVERALLSEAEAAKKAGRRGDQVHALLELLRLSVERGALADAGRTARTVAELLAPTIGNRTGKEGGDTPLLSEEERLRWDGELLVLRALLLAGIGERELAEARVKELEARAKSPAARQRVQELRGDLAARAGEAKSAAALLDKATRPTMRLALALALASGKVGEQADPARARTIMEDLGKRLVNDLEGALSRSRARAWLKGNPAPPETKETKETKEASP